MDLDRITGSNYFFSVVYYSKAHLVSLLVTCSQHFLSYFSQSICSTLSVEETAHDGIYCI